MRWRRIYTPSTLPTQKWLEVCKLINVFDLKHASNVVTSYTDSGTKIEGSREFAINLTEFDLGYEDATGSLESGNASNRTLVMGETAWSLRDSP